MSDNTVNFELGHMVEFGWELPETEPRSTVTITAVDHEAASFEYTARPVHGTDYELRFGKPTGPDTIVMHPKNYAALVRWQEEQRALKTMNRKQRRAEMSRRRKR